VDTPEQVETAFAALAGEYRFRKGLAEGAVHEWRWGTGSWFDLRPLYFERHGWAPGRRLRQVPSHPDGLIECGLDRMGRVLVEREFNKFGFYETFYRWASEPLEVAHFHHWPEKPPINLVVVHMAGDRAVASDMAAIHGHTREEYRWDDDLVREVDVAYAKRVNGHLSPLLPQHRVRARYDEGGAVQRVERLWPPSLPWRVEEVVEVTFERRGKRIFRPKP
jgi:hypothetical protein